MELRAFYDLMQNAGTKMPPVESWLAFVSSNSELWPIAKNGDIVGGILFVGHSIHIFVKPEWHGRWLTKTMLRAFRESWMHEADIYATPDSDNVAANNLARRLGFQHKGKQGQSEIYVKEARCPSQ